MDDAGYREVAERALGYARVEFRDEIASLKRENAALKRKVGRKPRGGGSAAGHGPVVEDDPDSSSLLLAVKRARTLALFLLLLSCTTAILEGYEETLAAHVSLSFFVPFLIGHGGNCGGMSVGAVISAIARGDARTPSSKYRLALREILAGCAVAVQLAALAALAMYLTGFDRDLSTVVVAALAAITALGAVCGSVIPLALDWAGLDAATVAPPAVTTLIDALGIVIYLTVARAVLDVSPAAHAHADHAAEAAMAAAAAAASNVVEDVVKAAASAAEGVVEGVASEL